MNERRVIAWDGEGVKLSGERKPQHYVLFGCSAEPDSPLRIAGPKDDLDFVRLADYIARIGERYPHAIHVGYFFKYDHNMIIKSLPWPMKAALYEKNKCRLRRGLFIYRIRWIPGKSITLSREHVNGGKTVRVTIDDLGPFFARSFVRAYEATFPVEDRGPQWPVVVEGKMMRADTTWDDMDAIEHYWRAEIIALERLAVWFRDLMCDAGFPLTKWYGPGALANLLRRRHALAVHEAGGKVQNMPPEVHDATKRAYFGGHVEQYHAGRVTGPVYVLDINSAYPAAFATLPSLAVGGEWRYREASAQDILRDHPMTLSVWHARWMMGGKAGRSLAPMMPQPLPHRDANREITYPPMCEGWYWQPELEAAMRAMLMHKRGTVEVFGGWEWFPANDERPWAFMEDMYEHRARLKAMGNPMEMAFKLGMNSMYGKMAQRAGWDTETREPPRSHTLPLAGYVTAYCRGAIMSMVQRILDVDPEGVIAVETDGIFTTVDPAHVGVTESKALGEWSVDVYDELMYIQNGVYALRQGDRWAKVKTRGMSANSVSPEGLAAYLATLRAGEKWEPLKLPQGEVFVGLGSAISRATTTKGTIAWPKAAALHCRWEKQNKDVVPGVRGKRIHIADTCPACTDGVSAHARAHPLRVRSTAINGAVSAPYALPWERGFVETEYERMDERTSWEERQENT